jgi:hypothetical protein
MKLLSAAAGPSLFILKFESYFEMNFEILKFRNSFDSSMSNFEIQKHATKLPSS